MKRETSPTNPFQRKSTIQVKMRQVGWGNSRVMPQQ